jgi:hypothetical protein
MWLDQLKLAHDPRTPPAQLRTMAQDPMLRAAVAGNPNTPSDLLVELTQDGPDAVLQNPAFELMLLDDPDLWGQLPGLRLLAASPCCPDALAHWFLRQSTVAGGEHEALREPLAANLAFPVALRQRVRFQAPAALRLEVTAEALESSVGTVCADTLVALGMELQDLPSQVDASLHPSAVHALCELGPLAHLRAAAHPSCPDDWLERFIGSDLDALALAQGLAGRSPMSEATATFLAKQTSPRVVELLVKNEGLPDPLLLKLAQRPEVWVRDELVRWHRWRIAGLREAFEESGSAPAQKTLAQALQAIEAGRGRAR